MSRIRYSAVALLAVAALATSTSTAQASFQLRLTSFTSGNVQNGQVTITDDGSGDILNSTGGAILFAGTVGNFTINNVTGLSKPVLGTAAFPNMDLNSVNVSSAAGGKLRIELTDTDFTPTSAGVFSGGVGGTLNTIGTNSVSFNAYKSNTNQAFDQSNLAASLNLGTFAGVNSFSSGTITSNHGPIGGNYSITMTTFLVHSTAGSTSYDYTVFNTPVPEPATIVSAILGLPMLGGYFWRRRVAA